MFRRISMRQYASSPRKDKSGYERSEERGYKTLQRAQVALARLVSSSAASFPERNECSGTHCSLIEQEEREDSSCQICHRV